MRRMIDLKAICARAACLLIAFLAFAGCESADNARQDAPISESTHAGIFIISYGQGSADTIAAPGADSMIVLDWLRYGCDSLQRPLEIQEYAFGVLVTGIGTKRNGDEGYWVYKVNGESVPESASAHRVAANDTVQFFFK